MVTHLRFLPKSLCMASTLWSAPFWRSSSNISKLSFLAAAWPAVQPVLGMLAFTSAPFSINHLADSI